MTGGELAVRFDTDGVRAMLAALVEDIAGEASGGRARLVRLCARERPYMATDAPTDVPAIVDALFRRLLLDPLELSVSRSGVSIFRHRQYAVSRNMLGAEARQIVQFLIDNKSHFFLKSLNVDDAVVLCGFRYDTMLVLDRRALLFAVFGALCNRLVMGQPNIVVDDRQHTITAYVYAALDALAQRNRQLAAEARAGRRTALAALNDETAQAASELCTLLKSTLESTWSAINQ